MINFAFINIVYINIVSFDVDNVKAINSTNRWQLWLKIFKFTGKKYSYLFLSHLKILSYGNYLILSSPFLKFFFSIFVFFLCSCKAPNSSNDSDLQSCSKVEFYTSKSVELHEKLDNVKRTTSVAYFTI